MGGWRSAIGAEYQTCLIILALKRHQLQVCGGQANHTLPLSAMQTLLIRRAGNGNAADCQRAPFSTRPNLGAKDKNKQEKAMEEITFNLSQQGT